jgi:hypothetical protein
MAKKRIELNPLTDTPKNKLDITKTFMKTYLENKGSVEDKKWFASIVRENIVEKSAPSNPSVKVRTYDLAIVRDAFVDRFFPQMKKKSGAEKDLDDILSWEQL